MHLIAVELPAGLAKITEGGDFQLLLSEIIFEYKSHNNPVFKIITQKLRLEL